MTINEREKKFLIIGVLAAVLIIAYHLFSYYSELKDTAFNYRSEKTFMLQKQLSKIQEKDSIQRHADEIMAEITKFEKLFLKGNKQPVAAANLQRILKDMANTLSVNVTVERALNSSETMYYRTVPIEIGFISTTGKLKDLLIKIRQSPYQLNVSELKVRVKNISKPEDINVTLVVTGFIRNNQDKDEEKKEGANVT
ncbi:MAG: hypothetical protein ISR96_09715 [Nitrospira sp.]|nr:hypothetical protein [bacterium]MBL7049777.1 hypothetical protein [Nitrospira sp.]